MQPQSNIRCRGNDGSPEHISGMAASWEALEAYFLPCATRSIAGCGCI